MPNDQVGTRPERLIPDRGARLSDVIRIMPCSRLKTTRMIDTWLPKGAEALAARASFGSPSHEASGCDGLGGMGDWGG